ncbi:HEAT repeat domain-containing protein [Tautonia plasticadhaerens]|uniref:HEAT repeat protein n=1 Tax=Tautonia plasticadhaerens TaxID=2527974 RepID=A0A518H8P6_9BACT|nr:HEAT repeat domain-containing protein [Tautonia plasticadhaerens]QDV37228.1 HEAT repeat protein [Tautonia plasticadhaerens]
MDGRSPRLTGSALLPIVLCLAAFSTGCGGVGFIGTTASSFLRHVRESEDPNVRYAAFTKLADPSCYDDESQKTEAVRELVAALEGGQESVATQAAICRTLGALDRPEALTALRKAALADDPIVRAQACRSLGRIGTAEDGTILARVMATDVSRDCRVAAIEAMGTLEQVDPRIGLSLVEGMCNPDPAIRAASYQALKEVTGEDLGFEVDQWDQLARSRLGEAAPPM